LQGDGDDGKGLDVPRVEDRCVFYGKCEEMVSSHCAEASAESGAGTHELSMQWLQEPAFGT